jgi:16S rRNA (uracil1498-N3)-methyltransferase
MHLFHCPDLGAGTVPLPDEEAHHALHVLRLRAGSTVGLLDGKGGFAEAELTTVDKKQCLATVIRRDQAGPERTARIHIAVAPTKQMERFEWFLEKATELGVDRITPLQTQRTERTKLRHDRLERVLVGAMKQSQRRWLPQLDPLTPLAELAHTACAQRFFGWCEGERVELARNYNPEKDALIAIGPEGDFTPEEAGMLTANGFRAVSLGASRLRTETAALAACAGMNFAQLR